MRGFPADISVSAVRRPGGQLRGAARCGEQRGSGQSVGGGAGGENTENTVSMGPHLATVTILLANIALAASELSTAGRYYYP